MSLKYHAGSAWADVSTVKYHTGSAWATPTAKYYHNGTAWVSLLTPPPSNMVLLYDSTTIPSGYLANGSNGTTNLLDRFVYGSTAFGTSGGYGTHDGSHHGAASATTSSYTHSTSSQQGFYDGDTQNYYTTTSHTHTVASHSHGGTVNNISLMSYKKLVPVMNAQYIGQNAVFLKASSLSQADWSALVTASYYLYLASSVGNVAGTTHSHSSYTINTSSYTIPITSTRNSYSPLSWPRTHYHTANHSLSTSGEQTPTYQQLFAYKYTGTNPLGMESIPIGSIAIFTSATLPSGWTGYNGSDSRLLRMGTSNVQGGTLQHQHSSSSITTGARTGTTTEAAVTPAYRSILAHTHTFTDNHTGAAYIMPVYTTFVIGVRTS